MQCYWSVVAGKDKKYATFLVDGPDLPEKVIRWPGLLKQNQIIEKKSFTILKKICKQN